MVCLGFGYDSVNHDYKVVALHHCYEGDDVVGMCVHVYSLRRGSREIGSSIFPYKWRIITSAVTSGIFVNGCIHWAVSRIEDLEKVAVIAFNAVEEELHELPLPSLDDIPTSGFYPITLCGAGGCLWMFSPDKSKDRTDVWVMKQYGVQESWTKVGTTRIEAHDIMAVGLSSQDEVVLYEKFLVIHLQFETRHT